jgi:hypothetical protein
VDSRAQTTQRRSHTAPSADPPSERGTHSDVTELEAAIRGIGFFAAVGVAPSVFHEEQTERDVAFLVERLAQAGLGSIAALQQATKTQLERAIFANEGYRARFRSVPDSIVRRYRRIDASAAQTPKQTNRPAPSHPVVSFGEQTNRSAPSHSVISFGEPVDRSAPSHNVISLGERRHPPPSTTSASAGVAATGGSDTPERVALSDRPPFWERVRDGPAAWLQQQTDAPEAAAASGAEAVSSMSSAAGATLKAQALQTAHGPGKDALDRQLRDDFDPSLLPFVLPVSEKHSRLVNNKAETLEELRKRPMPTTFSSPATAHVPVLHFQEEQLKRAATLGLVDFYTDPDGAVRPINGSERLVAAGPSPYPDYDLDGYSGPPPPATAAELYVDFDGVQSATWNSIVEWFRIYCSEIERVEKGYSFQMSRIPGGEKGLHIPADRIKPQWRHLTWQIVGFEPHLVKPALPDFNSTVDLFAVYRDAIAADVDDKEIVSMLALFGIQAKCSMSRDTYLVPNYKQAWLNLGDLQAAYEKKLTAYGDKPRASHARPYPNHVPSRLLPKGCVTQVKDDGRVKVRETVDAGALRQALRDLKRLKQQDQQNQIDFIIDRIEQFRKNSPPGEDSPNGTMDMDSFGDFKWGSVEDFGEQVDILVASGEPITVLQFDFEGYYLQFPRDVQEWWWCEEAVSSAGAHVAHRASFGMSDLPALLSRFNHVICELIRRRLEYEQARFPAEKIPDHVKEWMAERAAAGQSQSWTGQLPFFDDNSFCCLSLGGEWTDTVKRVATEVWAKYAMTVEHSKTMCTEFGDDTEAPVLGVIIDAARRQRRLPKSKVDKYSGNVDAVIAAAEAHPQNLVEKTAIQQILGRLLFGLKAGIPTMRGDFMILLSHLSGRWSRKWLKLGTEARSILRHMQWRLHHENGCALTAYRARPGEDDATVLVSYTDAGRQGEWPTVTRAGYGGFVFEQNSKQIFYFHGTWPAELTQNAELDINILESLASTYSADVADQVLQILGKADQPHYLYSIGDSAVFFAHLTENGRASSPGLRYIYRERTEADHRRKSRTNCFLHVSRCWNRAADKLANGDVDSFRAELRWLLGSGLTLREIQPRHSSITDLCAHVMSCRRRNKHTGTGVDSCKPAPRVEPPGQRRQRRTDAAHRDSAADRGQRGRNRTGGQGRRRRGSGRQDAGGRKRRAGC